MAASFSKPAAADAPTNVRAIFLDGLRVNENLTVARPNSLSGTRAENRSPSIGDEGGEVGGDAGKDEGRTVSTGEDGKAGSGTDGAGEDEGGANISSHGPLSESAKNEIRPPLDFRKRFFFSPRAIPVISA
jgi:hypothetical protein